MFESVLRIVPIDRSGRDAARVEPPADRLPGDSSSIGRTVGNHRRLPSFSSIMSGMLKLIPEGWFSWHFRIIEGARPVAEIDMSRWRERGTLSVGGAPYRVYRERLMGGSYVLESEGKEVARAEKLSAFRRSFELSHAGRVWTLRARSALGRAFVLSDGKSEAGSISPDGFLTRRATARLPETLPLPVRVFLLWLVTILWKRAADSATT